MVKKSFYYKEFITGISKILKKIIPQQIKWKIKNLLIQRKIAGFINEEKFRQKKKKCSGINLVGSIKADMGLGQSSRLLANMLKECGYRFSIYNYDFNGLVSESDTTFDAYISEEMPYDINLFHINPCELGNFFIKNSRMWKDKYNIAFWLWELEEFPKEWICFCQLFDEIWTPSKFAALSMQKITEVPIHTVPYYVTAPYNPKITRKYWDLPKDKFLYLVMYDVNSTDGRKNPQGAISAFKKAFPHENDDVGMIIKINNAKQQNVDVINKQLKDYNNIFLLTDIMDKQTVNSLIKCADVLVSLHRAEGFGLVMAEAMLLDTPVIATNWSSNVEFMDENTACMVRYKLVKNPKREGLYPKGCIWAEPDYEQASYYMKELFYNATYYSAIKNKGKAYIQEKLGQKRTIENLKNILENH